LSLSKSVALATTAANMTTKLIKEITSIFHQEADNHIRIMKIREILFDKVEEQSLKKILRKLKSIGEGRRYHKIKDVIMIEHIRKLFRDEESHQYIIHRIRKSLFGEDDNQQIVTITREIRELRREDNKEELNDLDKLVRKYRDKYLGPNRSTKTPKSPHMYSTLIFIKLLNLNILCLFSKRLILNKYVLPNYHF